MSEENRNINDFDLMVKSVLDEGQEDVPARIWEGVAEGLDKAARRKTVVLWWRRSAIAAAAAAAVAVGVILNHDTEEYIIPHDDGNGLIAVAEPVQVIEEPETIAEEPYSASQRILIAEAPEAVSPDTESFPTTAGESIAAVAGPVTAVSEPIINTEDNEKEETTDEAPSYFPETWEDTEKAPKRDISFVFSGLASTNNAQSQNKFGPMKAPTLTAAPQKTGITETSTKSSYGIPLSFGAGVRIGLSPKWSLGVGANYTFLTRQFYGKYTSVSEEGNIEGTTSSDIRNTQHFIGIPVNAFYNIVNTRNLNFYAYAGGTIEKCISDNYRVLSTTIRHKEEVKGVQLSANLGFGIEFMLGKHLGLYIDPSLRYYFDNNQPKSIRTVQPLMLGFEMGLRARL